MEQSLRGLGIESIEDVEAIVSRYDEAFAIMDTPNYAKEVEMMRILAEHGYAKAQLQMGKMCSFGFRVQKDDVGAAEWYRKSAEQGYVTAQYNLGLMYKNGIGVRKDGEKAVEWFQKAAEQGHEKAKSKLHRMCKKRL